MRDFSRFSDPVLNRDFSRPWCEPDSYEAAEVALRQRVKLIHAAGPSAVAGLVLELVAIAGMSAEEAAPVLNRHASQPAREAAS